ncbi:MFS transporter [Hathewaya histolytica]|uniref:MFS transporter n=1 Tax=Hathewaya histolytica TaxID=1498 RepID=UPI003B6721C4
MSTLKNYWLDIKESPRDAKLFLLSYFLFAIQWGAYFTVYTILIQMMFGTVAVGSMLSLNTILLGVLAIPMGMLTNKVGFKKMMIFASVIGAISFGITAYVPNMFTLILATLLAGPPSSVWDILPPPILNSLTTEKQRTTIYSIMYAGNWGVIALVSKLSGNGIVFLQNHFGITEIAAYKGFLVITAILSGLSLIPILFMNDIKLKIEEKKEKKSLKESFKEVANREVVIFLIYSGLIGLGAGLFTPFMANFLKDGLKLSPLAIGNITFLKYFVMVICMLLCPIIEKKIGTIHTIGITSLLSIPFMMAIANAHVFGDKLLIPIITVSFLMRSGLMNLNMPLAYTQILEFVEPEKRATVTGLQSSFRCITQSLSSFIAGFVMQIPAFTFMGLYLDGYRIPYYIAAVLYVIAQIILYKVYFKKYNWAKRDKEATAETKSEAKA